MSQFPNDSSVALPPSLKTHNPHMWRGMQALIYILVNMRASRATWVTPLHGKGLVARCVPKAVFFKCMQTANYNNVLRSGPMVLDLGSNVAP